MTTSALARRDRAAERETDRCRYGGSWFSAASAWPHERGLIRPSRWPAVVAAAVRRPSTLAALIAMLVRTRSEQVVLSGSVAGEALRDHFSQRTLGVFPLNRLCRGVLLLPRDHADYLRGRRRQALRTNLRRARAAGISCEVMADRARAHDQILEGFRGRGASTDEAGWEALLERPEMTLMVARDRNGRPLAHAGVVIDDTVALIHFAVATSHDARWALHDHLVQTLIERRVRYLLAVGGGPFGALGFDRNVQHYQHLLGYQLRHIAIAKPEPARRCRTLVASALLVTVTAVSLVVPPAAAAMP